MPHSSIKLYHRCVYKGKNRVHLGFVLFKHALGVLERISCGYGGLLSSVSSIIAGTPLLTHKLGRIPILICQVFFELSGSVGESCLVEADHGITNFGEEEWIALTE